MATTESDALVAAIAGFPALMQQVADLTLGMTSSAKRIESALPVLKVKHDQLAGAADAIETAAGVKSNGG